MASDDRALLARLRAGDQGAISELVQRYASDLHRFAYVWTQETSLAEDIVQDVFLYLWRRREQLDIRGTLKGYLLRATRNRALDVLQHERSRRRVEGMLVRDTMSLLFSSNDGDTVLERDDLVRTVQEALAMLPPRTREIFLLRREQEMSYAEIAETLGIGIPTIHNQMSRAAKAVQTALERWRLGSG